MRFGAKEPSVGDISKARDLHRRGQVSEAELAYAAIIERDPGQTDALHYLGLIKREQGRRVEAYHLLTAALARCSRAQEGVADIPDIHIKRGDILYGLERYFEAVASYDRALSLAPPSAGCLIKRGHSLYQINRYEASLASYERALALAPGDATILIYRARTLRQLGRCEEALADLDQVLTQQPDFARVCNLRGEILASLTRYDEAVAQFELALRMIRNSSRPVGILPSRDCCTAIFATAGVTMSVAGPNRAQSGAIFAPRYGWAKNPFRARPSCSTPSKDSATRSSLPAMRRLRLRAAPQSFSRCRRSSKL